MCGKPNLIKQGFKKGGILPFNKNAVDRSKFDPESLNRYENRNILLDRPIIVDSATASTESEDLDEPRPGQSTSHLHEEASRPTTKVPVDQTVVDQALRTVSFEDLLLDTMTQSPTVKKATK